MAGGREWQEKSSAAAIGLGIAAVKLFHVELSRRKSAARTSLSVSRTKVTFVGGVAAPFTQPTPNASCHSARAASVDGQAKACPTLSQATPQAAQEAGSSHRGAFHQSSPWATPEKLAAQRVAMYGDS